MSNGPIRIVCFDWGGVILRICRTWAEGCQRAGLPVRADMGTEAMKVRRREVSREYQSGAMESGPFFDAMSRAMGGAYTPDEVRRVHHAWLIGEYPGVAALVARVHAAESVRTALLSNTNHEHWMRGPGARGAAPEFPTAAALHLPHASHIMRLHKPDEPIYRAFEGSVGASPREILFFDDLEDNIAASLACGWDAVRIDHEGDTAAQMADALKVRGVLG